MIKRITRTSRVTLVAFSIMIGALGTAGVLSYSAFAGGATPLVRYHPIGTHTVRAQGGASIAGLTRAASNPIPAAASTELARLSGGGIGNVAVGQAKTLLAENLAWGGTIYAAPSSTGQACYLVLGGPDSCVSAFTQSTPIAFAKFDRDGPGGDPVTVAGLAPDDVTAIDVEAGGATYHAALTNNAFFFQMPAGIDSAVSGLTIRYSDGTSLQQPLAPLKSENG